MSSEAWTTLRNTSNFLFWVMLIALFIRVIWFVSYTQYENYKITIDSDQYHEIAIQITQGKGFSTKSGAPNFFRLPAYPLFLGALYKVLGTTPQKALYVQLALSILVVPLIFALSCTIFPGNLLVAKIATVASALHPGFILFSGMQATETLFLLFFLFFIIFFFKGIDDNRLSYFCISGFSLGIASLFRALGHYVIIICMVMIFLLLKESFLKRFYAAGILFLSWFSIFGIWIARNYMLTGLLFVHTLTGQHFLRYNAVHILMDVEKSSWERPHNELFALRDTLVAQQESIKGRPLLEKEKDDIALQIAFQTIRHHPLLALKHACKQILATCVSLYSLIPVQLPPGTIFGSNTPTSYKVKMYFSCMRTYPIILLLILWDLLFTSMLLLGMIFFIFFSLKDCSLRKIMVLIFPLIALLLVITLSIGLARLRFPIEPFLIVLATYGLVHLWQTNHKLKQLRFKAWPR